MYYIKVSYCRTGYLDWGCKAFISGIQEAVVRQSSGSHQAVFRQSEGIILAIEVARHLGKISSSTVQLYWWRQKKISLIGECKVPDSFVFTIFRLRSVVARNLSRAWGKFDASRQSTKFALCPVVGNLTHDLWQGSLAWCFLGLLSHSFFFCLLLTAPLLSKFVSF